MNGSDWYEEAVGKHHDRDAFDCGDANLNEFLRKHARQSHEAGGAKTFLAIARRDRRVIGFYSVCPASLHYEATPALARKKLARHDVPVFRLARLGVDRTVQGQVLGGQLLLAAGRRCLRVAAEVGGVGLLIDAKNSRAAAWYASYGALPLEDTPYTLVLPFGVLQKALGEAGLL
ncbi:MAG: GNAT family N-acetyltransferase [Candidatus Hydrogenedentes bacterium]|nr:GNAT family N-acetyltransferase [Candidatus Hydrogenedentota bacterium]